MSLTTAGRCAGPRNASRSATPPPPAGPTATADTAPKACTTAPAAPAASLTRPLPRSSSRSCGCDASTVSARSGWPPASTPARDPGGALAFACLLLLADYEEGAQFWLQYAAGGGQATGAVCLLLLHLHRGEWRDAKFWAEQITVLEAEPYQYAPVAHKVLDTTFGPGGVTVHLDLPDDVAAVPEEAVRDAVDDLAVDTLDGLAIPQPSPDLAHQLQDFVSH